jgi:hypothetical protein
MTGFSPSTDDSIELKGLGLHAGGALLVKRRLARIATGERVKIQGSSPTLRVDLGAWCRAQGHTLHADSLGLWVERGRAAGARLVGAERAGNADPQASGAVHEAPPLRWGLAARGALVEAGSPEIEFLLRDKQGVWTDDAARLYAQAVAQQWDPAIAIPWSAAVELPVEVEDAVVQVMTYLVENETAALLVPARFLSQLHPHFREVMQLLAVQTADEARHIEVFTRRGLLRRSELGLSTAGGQASLKTLLDEPDFALASFLLSVLGEGTFLSLLAFLRNHAPDPVMEAIMRLTHQDEARHVAFGLSHLVRHVASDPSERSRLASAVERRHAALSNTAGLNEEVFDALTLLAAGSFEPEAIESGHAAVIQLTQEMDTARRQRLERLGFSSGEAQALSELHTRNFM